LNEYEGLLVLRVWVFDVCYVRKEGRNLLFIALLRGRGAVTAYSLSQMRVLIARCLM